MAQCKNGHERTPANTLASNRRCRACFNDRRRISREASTQIEREMGLGGGLKPAIYDRDDGRFTSPPRFPATVPDTYLTARPAETFEAAEPESDWESLGEPGPRVGLLSSSPPRPKRAPPRELPWIDPDEAGDE